MALAPESLDAAAAAVLGPVLARRAVEEAGGREGVFGAASALRQVSAALGEAADRELQAERHDEQAHQRWRQAHDGLLAEGERVADALAARARMGHPGAAALRTTITADLGRWADPFAADATGAPLLDALAQALAQAGPGLAAVVVPLVGAVSRTLLAGQARDRAEAERATAIRARVMAEGAWRVAVARLEGCADLDLASEVSALARAETDAEVGWFEE